MDKAYIKAIEYYLPERVLDNETLASIYSGWTAEQIQSKTGVSIRHIADEHETSLDLARCACEKLFSHGELRREEVDFLIFITETPDYLIPPSAAVLQGQLNLPEKCGAFDINLGCTGYAYGLAVSKSLLLTGIANNILLVTTDTVSKLINPMDKSTRTLFGDAAAVTWVTCEGGLEIGEFLCGTRGKSFDRVIVPAGMFRTPSSEETKREHIDENGYCRSAENMFMDGTEVLSFAIEVVPRLITELLEKAQIRDEEVSLYVFHQASGFILSYLRRKLKIDKSRFAEEYGDIGNTASCTMPIAIKRRMDNGTFPKSGNVVLCGFGSGLSWNAMRLSIGE